MILTLMLLIIVGSVTFTILQTSVAPAVQQQTEARHYTVVRGDFQTLRNNLLATATQGIQTNTLVTMGSDYPSYLLLAQPPGPFGRVQTTGPRRITLSNVEATDPDVQDLLEAQDVDGDGSATTITLRPQGVAYTPQYHQFPAPTIYTWPTGVVVAKLSNGSRLIADQSLVAGRQLTLVNVTGSIARGQAAPISTQASPESASAQTITISEASDGPVTLSVPTALPEQQALDLWNKSLEEELDQTDDDCQVGNTPNTEFVCDIGFNENNPDTVTDNRVVISLEYDSDQGESVRYRLSAALVGLKTREEAAPPVNTSPRYLVTASFAEPTVSEGNKVQLAVELRDQYHNPVAGRLVHAKVQNISAGTFAGSPSSDRLTGRDGRATFVFTATEDNDAQDEQTDVTVWIVPPGTQPGPNPPAEPYKKVTFTVSVQDPDTPGNP